MAATAIYSYAVLVPLALWGFLTWRSRTITSLVSYSFLQIVCVYGYSLSIYIPAVVSHTVTIYTWILCAIIILCIITTSGCDKHIWLFSSILYYYYFADTVYLLVCVHLCEKQILWIIPSERLRWCSIVVALCLSGSVLVMTFWPAIRDDKPKITLAIISTIIILHALLAVGCKVCF